MWLRAREDSPDSGQPTRTVQWRRSVAPAEGRLTWFRLTHTRERSSSSDPFRWATSTWRLVNCCRGGGTGGGGGGGGAGKPIIGSSQCAVV